MAKMQTQGAFEVALAVLLGLLILVFAAAAWYG
jgi:hypothetical protein